MRYFKTLYTFIFILLISIFMVTVPVSAKSNGSLIYYNDFSSKKIDETMCFNEGGTTSVEKEIDNYYLRCKVDSTKSAFRLNFGPEEEKNVDISVKMRLDGNKDNNARAGIYFRSTTIPAYDLLAYQLRLYQLNINLTYADAFADGNVFTSISDYTDSGVKFGLWNNVKLCLRGNRIVAFVNGEKAIDVIDDKYPDLGGFGFCSLGMSFDVDDISIIKYTGKNLPEPTKNEVPDWVGDPLDEEEPDFPDSGMERLNLNFLGGEKDNDVQTKVNIVDPNKLTTNSYIAIGLIIALVLMATSSLIVTLLLLKERKKEKKNSLPSIKNPLDSSSDTNNE